VDPFDAVGADDFRGFVDALGDLIRRFHGVGFDVDDAQAYGDFGFQVFEVNKFGVAAEGELEDDVVAVEAVHEVRSFRSRGGRLFEGSGLRVEGSGKD